MQENTVSVAPNATSGVDVMAADGNYWHYVGTTRTLIAGPHLALTAPSGATAWQPASVTLTVLNALDQPVSGYTGTVTLSSDDLAVGPPPSHSFVAADNGSFTFTTTLKTVGNRTLTAGDGTIYATAGLTAQDAAPSPGGIAAKREPPQLNHAM